MLGAKLLTLIGLVMQAFGTILLTLPIWGHAFGLAAGFQTEAGSHIDRAGRWPCFVRVGLGVLILGYIASIAAICFG